MKIRRLCSDWVLVQIDPMPDKIGSILMPDVVKACDTHTGTVVMVGPGRWHEESGLRIPVEVRVGDKVCFHRWNLEHKQGQAIVHALGDLAPDHGLIREADVLFTWPPDERHTFW